MVRDRGAATVLGYSGTGALPFALLPVAWWSGLVTLSPLQGPTCLGHSWLKLCPQGTAQCPAVNGRGRAPCAKLTLRQLVTLPH